MSVTNLYLTEMTFLEQDWKMVMVFGASYIPFNIAGQWRNKSPMYPYTDWENRPFTALFLLSLQAVLFGFVHRQVCRLSKKLFDKYFSN